MKENGCHIPIKPMPQNARIKTETRKIATTGSSRNSKFIVIKSFSIEGFVNSDDVALSHLAKCFEALLAQHWSRPG